MRSNFHSSRAILSEISKDWRLEHPILVQVLKIPHGTRYPCTRRSGSGCSASLRCVLQGDVQPTTLKFVRGLLRYRDTSLIRTHSPLGPYSRTVPASPRGMAVSNARYLCIPRRACVQQSSDAWSGLPVAVEGCFLVPGSGIFGTGIRESVQGYLTYEKRHPPGILPQACA